MSSGAEVDSGSPGSGCPSNLSCDPEDTPNFWHNQVGLLRLWKTLFVPHQSLGRFPSSGLRPCGARTYVVSPLIGTCTSSSHEVGRWKSNAERYSVGTRS
jgi:hypothetical protein